MSAPRDLSGGCSCGRNNYTIRVPSDSLQRPRVIFSSSYAHRRSHATPLSAYLRIPLAWYRSTTTSYLPDETPTAIRRVYTSPTEQATKRNFCGFCGTPLSYWSESPPTEAKFISLTLCSLQGSDLHDLDEWGVLPTEASEDATHEQHNLTFTDGIEDLPWFETLVQGSRLGRMKKSWGEQRSRNGNGRYKVEWEVLEWTEGDEEDHPLTPVKRKIGELVEDYEMLH